MNSIAVSNSTLFLTALTELSFTWFGFITAMLSNFFYQFRIVMAKFELSDSDPQKSHEAPLSPAQLFRVVTLLAALELFPLSLFLEGDSITSKWNAAVNTAGSREALIIDLVVSGFTYYAYNEVAFWILGKINPITHAVGNTIKRVVIIVASVVILQSPMTTQGVVGSALAVAGTLLYSVMLQRHAGGSAGATPRKKKESQLSF